MDGKTTKQATSDRTKNAASTPVKKNSSIKSFFTSKIVVSAKAKAKALAASPRKSSAKHNAAICIKSPVKPTLPPGAIECIIACPEIGEGWTQKIVKRKNDTSGIVSDRYFFSPNDGKKFRSMVEVNRFLNGVEENAASPTKPHSFDKAKTNRKSPAPKEKNLKTIQPGYPVGTVVSKIFHDHDVGQDRAFSGRVMKYDSVRSLYWVRYEDGDEEELGEKDLSKIVDDDDRMDHCRSDDEGITPETEQVKRKDHSSRGLEVNNAIKKKPRTSKLDVGDINDDDEDVDNTRMGKSQSLKKSAFEVLLSKNPRRSVKKKIVYTEESDSDQEGFEDNIDKAVPKNATNDGKRAIKADSRVGKGKNKRILDSDSDEFELGHEVEEDDDSIAADTESEVDVDSDEEYERAPKKKNGKRTASSSKKLASKKGRSEKKPAAKKGETVTPGSIEALCASKAKDIKVMNNPQQFPDDGPYVEPVGIDATDGIVEGIIGGMVQKVGKLLLETIKRSDAERELGELSFPIKLNTACSGTDAPSIALGLVKESLDRFCSSQRDSDEEKSENGDQVKGHGFDYEHNMSCEIEPFKQAYIGRNFPGVLLFPDITKLTENETVVDVYGRAQKIPQGERISFMNCVVILEQTLITIVLSPPGNIFVAGTSCKDFSMLKSSHRKGEAIFLYILRELNQNRGMVVSFSLSIDIEDKGTSGETFLAAVEYLEQEKPAIAIFENVDKAPWEKMQEYIQGRLHLKERNSIKNITEIKKNQAGECVGHFSFMSTECTYT